MTVGFRDPTDPLRSDDPSWERSLETAGTAIDPQEVPE